MAGGLASLHSQQSIKRQRAPVAAGNDYDSKGDSIQESRAQLLPGELVKTIFLALSVRAVPSGMDSGLSHFSWLNCSDNSAKSEL